jgi:hypothetical protein
MRTIYIYLIAVIVLFGAGFTALNTSALADTRPEVEVVFCLDTTGSMGGLIEGAKQKIWAIANRIILGEPSPLLRIGLVGYRDIGDAYVTKVFPLEDDLDSVFENLMSFQAAGGGDTPEHVNKALNDAVREIKWSEKGSTLKLIFLVGDCPPHTDYSDGYDFRKTCAEAVMKDIIINTVQCGNYPETAKYWRMIARLSEGSYSAIAQSGGMEIIETPMDAELSRLSLMLEDTIVPFGSKEERSKYSSRKEKVAGMPSPAAAERAVYKADEHGAGPLDLVDCLKNGSVKLENIKDQELPEQMKGMTLEEKKIYLAEKEAEREKIKDRIRELSGKRSAYIAEQLKKMPEEESFDEVVLEHIKEQAADKGIKY